MFYFFWGGGAHTELYEESAWAAVHGGGLWGDVAACPVRCFYPGFCAKKNDQSGVHDSEFQSGSARNSKISADSLSFIWNGI